MAFLRFWLICPDWLLAVFQSFPKICPGWYQGYHAIMQTCCGEASSQVASGGCEFNQSSSSHHTSLLQPTCHIKHFSVDGAGSVSGR